MRLLALANPRSGGGRALARLARYRALATTHEVSWVIAAGAEDLRARINAAPLDGFEGVLLVGGDGTLNDALGPLVETGLPVAVLPAGRGNDFARAAGFNGTSVAALLASGRPEIRRLDVGVVNGRPFASVAGVGFDGVVSRLANQGTGLWGGTAGYVVCVLRALAAFRPWTVEVVVDQWTWRGAVTLVAVANGPCFGGGMRIAPNAAMDDAQLDVCIVGAMSRAQLLAEFPKIFWGGHTAHRAVVMRRGRVVRIEADGPEDIYADGEWAGRTPGAWSVLSGGLRVFVASAGGA
jgi:diacylglycerol kinase (ATP)